MSVLFPSFAKQVREKHLKELTTDLLAVLRKLDVPLLRLISLKPEAEVLAWLQAREEGFLQAVEAGTVMDWERERLAQWEQDALPGIPKGGLHPSDVILFHTAQRAALTRLVGRFSPDPSVKVELLNEIEAHFVKVFAEAMRTYGRMQALARR